MHTPKSELSIAQQVLQNAKRIAVLSGAGLSKASGIPTYRDMGGLWQRPENLKFSDIQSYRNDPGSFSGFWRARSREMRRARPNPGHRALRVLQQKRPTTLITQNVDGLLQQAGCTEVLELHGSLRRHRCGTCHRRSRGFLQRLTGRCLSCAGYIRPEVVLFGEELPSDTLHQANESATTCDVFMLVGSTALVYPAAELPVIAMKHRAKLIVIDPEPPLLACAADLVLCGKTEEILPVLVQDLCNK